LCRRPARWCRIFGFDDLEADPHFIKIDCEGMELAVIDGAVDKIKNKRPVIYVENDREEKSAELIAAIMALDYDLYWHMPPLFNPDNMAGKADNIFSKIISINMLCLPSEFKIRVDGVERVLSPQASWKEAYARSLAN